MTRIALASESFSAKKGFGMTRYALEVARGIQKKGFDATRIQSSEKIKSLTINTALYIPAKIAKTQNKYDLLHYLDPGLALSKKLVQKPTVATFSDLTPFSNVNEQTHYEKILRLAFKQAATCDALLAISAQTRKEMHTQFGTSEKNVVLAPPGVDERFKKLKREKNKQTKIGYVGGFNKRKQVDFTLRAFKTLLEQHDANAVLELYGPPSQNEKNLKKLSKKLGITSSVNFNGLANDEKLPKIYNSFDAFAYASVHEGFGMPVLEAQRCGVPVVLRANAKIPKEVSKEALKAKNEEDMAKHLADIASDSRKRRRLVERSTKHAKKFTWKNTVKQTIKAYEKTL
ncbi:MAG: glycosyltransferase family 4 protein [Candidatus Micrarchaeia archaeon]